MNLSFMARKKSAILITVVIALILAVACGSSATATPVATVATAVPAPATAVPKAAPVATATTAAPSGGESASTPLIAPADIDPDRSRVPEGEMTIGVHVGISPRWMNPQIMTAGLMSYELAWKVHDNMFKPMQDNVFTYALAEFYEMSDDFMTATVRLREGVRFHNGELITSEDVQFSYENYHGANATLFQEFTESVELIDDRTVQFNFKKPFLDFLLNYGTPASAAGVIIPKAYYLSLGSTDEERDEAFSNAPIGAGPFKFVEQEAGISVTFEANTDYWRKVPYVKTLISRGIRDVAVRAAALKSGEVDFIYFVTGDVLESVINDPNLQVDPNNSGPFWLMFPDQNDPDSPFNDVRVREAVSLALDRQFLADRETLGLAIPTGNFIPPSWPGVVQRPPDKVDVARAKELMAEAGYEDGFTIDWFTPFPAVESMSLRVMEQIREIGIESKMQVMERPVYQEKLREGFEDDLNRSHKGFPGRQIVMAISVTPGNSATYINIWARCGGASSLVCDDRIDALWDQYLLSIDLGEREDLMKQAQNILLDEFMFVPIYVNAFALGQGSRVAGNPSDYTSVAMNVLLGPNEDLRLKPGQ